jgi:CheY-like chemotaxis protein
MDDGVRARIFDPFFTTKEEGKGTGLGLSTVIGIVERAGGAIAVESEPGRGTTFTISFPAADPGGERTARRVLVLEADEQVRALVRRVLEDAGYGVLEAKGKAPALEAAALGEGQLDLLVTDTELGEESGIDIAQRLLEVHPGLKVLFASDDPTAVAGPLGRYGTERVGLIGRPFTPATLARAVRELLEG